MVEASWIPGGFFVKLKRSYQQHCAVVADIVFLQ